MKLVLDMFITVKSDGKYSFHPVKPVSVARQVKYYSSDRSIGGQNVSMSGQNTHNGWL